MEITDQLSRFVAMNQDNSPKIDKNMPDKELKVAAEEFEALFVKIMLDGMKKTVEKSSLTEENTGTDFYNDMLYDEYSRLISKNSDMGIAKLIYNQYSNDLNNKIANNSYYK